MLINELIETKVSPKTLHRFKNIYPNVSIGDIIKIEISDLNLGSNLKISCICDNCKLLINISYYSYNVSTNNNEKDYYCKRCKGIRQKETCNRKYGVDNVFQSDIIKKISKQTKIEKYDNQNYNNREKYIDTCNETFGVDNPFQSEKIKEKIRKRFLENYGVNNPSKSDEIKERKRITNLKNNNVENPAQSDIIQNKMKSTCLKKYGFENPAQSDIIQNKISKTNFLKYGCSSPMQNLEIFNKTQKSSFKIKVYENINYQGSYELDFLEYSKSINILDRISKPKSIKYVFNTFNKVYYPDFFIEDLNLIIEIKSSYTYDKDLEKNLKKQKSCLEQGYNFIFIINKDYNKFKKIICQHIK